MALGWILLWLPIIAVLGWSPRRPGVDASSVDAGFRVDDQRGLTGGAVLVIRPGTGANSRRYFATRSAVITLVVQAVSLALGVTLDHIEHTFWGFPALFGFAIACGLAGNIVLRRIFEPPIVITGDLPSLRDFMLIPFRDRRFRPYLIYSVAWDWPLVFGAFLYSLYERQSAHYLALSYTWIVIMGAIMTWPMLPASGCGGTWPTSMATGLRSSYPPWGPGPSALLYLHDS